MITHNELKKVIHYDPVTGHFTWLVDAGGVSNGNHPRAGDRAGSLNKVHGYREIGIWGRLYRANRLAWLYMKGSWPSGDVDHKNLDKADDRWNNLRVGTRSQNLANRKAYNKLGIKGVRERNGRFIAQITINKKQIYLGSFDAAEKAHAAYIEAANLHYGEFARAS